MSLALSLQEHHVDELADGGGLGHLEHVFEVDAGLGPALAEFGVVLDLLDQVDDALFLAGVGLGEGVGDGLRRRQLRLHLGDVEQVAQVVQGRQIVGIADGDDQDLVLEGQRKHLVHAGHRLGDELQRFGLRLDILQVDDLEVVLFAQRLEELVLGDEASGHGDLADRLGGVLGLFENLPQLIFVEEAQIDEHLAEATASARRGLGLPFLGSDGGLGGRLAVAGLGGRPFRGGGGLGGHGLGLGAGGRLAGLDRLGFGLLGGHGFVRCRHAGRS